MPLFKAPLPCPGGFLNLCHGYCELQFKVESRFNFHYLFPYQRATRSTGQYQERANEGFP